MFKPNSNGESVCSEAQKRREKIWFAYMGGRTLKEIAAELGITTQRVSQLVVRHEIEERGHWPPYHSGTVRLVDPIEGVF